MIKITNDPILTINQIIDLTYCTENGLIYKNIQCTKLSDNKPNITINTNLMCIQDIIKLIISTNTSVIVVNENKSICMQSCKV